MVGMDGIDASSLSERNTIYYNREGVLRLTLTSD